MNRQNFIWHLALAVMLIAVAGFVGQIRRWQREGPPSFVKAPRAEFPDAERMEPDSSREARDVIVRFREGVSEERIREIVGGLNDEVDDEIESVEGMVEVFDRDSLPVEEVLAQYGGLEEVEYAEENLRIELDPQESLGPDRTSVV
jgi:hypothetical protein